MRKAPVSSNPAECPAFRTVKAYKIKIKSHTISNVHSTHWLFKTEMIYPKNVRAKVVMNFT